MITFQYRPDIDGLRAVAVLIVMLFHAGLGCPGGFAGVDVFFVISGFLITGLIFKQQQNRGFELRQFWVRRIRRIIPAATCVVCVSLAIGFVFLLPTDFVELARAATAQQLMAANFHYWLGTDYFSGSAELKPLLHTWSLAVEEQFYLFYPFLLILIGRLKPRQAAWTLVSLTLISFVYSEWSVRTNPGAAFYLLPSRAWELLLGGVLVFASAPRRHSIWIGEIAAWTGAGMILTCTVALDATSCFPGVSALLPCVGTALIIYSNSWQRNSVGKILACKPFVFVGLISYSLYLWHWPVLVFSRYWLGELSPQQASIALLISSALAVLSWRFVELPFRRQRQPIAAPETPFWLAGASAALLIMICSMVISNQGMKFRFSDQVLRYDVAEMGRKFESFHRDTDEARSNALPIVGTRNGDQRIDCLIWGDSHAMVTGTACQTIAERTGIRCAIAARTATVPLLEVWRPNDGRSAINWNRAVMDYVQRHQIKHVFLVSRWAVNIEGRPSGLLDSLIVDDQSTEVSPRESRQVLRRGLKRTIDQLDKMGAKVWIMEQVPCQYSNPTKRMAIAALLGQSQPVGVTRQRHLARQASSKRIMAEVDTRQVTILNPDPYFFDQSGTSKLGDQNGSFYFDDDHLSELGATRLLGNVIETVFHAAMNDAQTARPAKTTSLDLLKPGISRETGWQPAHSAPVWPVAVPRAQPVIP